MSAWGEYAVIMAIVLPALVLAERVAPENRGGFRPRGPRPADFTLAGLTWLVVPVVGAGTGALAAVILHHGLVVGAMDRHLPEAGVTGAAVAETVSYWLHRLSHRSRTLWSIHRLHHAPRQLDMVRGFRFHPIDVALQQAIPVGVVAAVGVSPAALVPYNLAVFVVTLFAHADLEMPEGLWQRVVVSPSYHRSHHELGRERTNFATVLPVLDVLFGTASFSRTRHRNFVEPSVPVQG